MENFGNMQNSQYVNSNRDRAIRQFEEEQNRYEGIYNNGYGPGQGYNNFYGNNGNSRSNKYNIDQNNPTPNGNYSTYYASKPTSYLGAISLTLGILSLLLSFFWYISIPCGILAIIKGRKARITEGSRKGKSAMILGIIGLSLCAIFYLLMIGYILMAL